MPDPVLIALIGGIVAVIGGVIGAISSPIGKDWVERRSEARSAARETTARRRERLERVRVILAELAIEGIVEGRAASIAELRGLAAAVNDAQLLTHVDGLLAAKPRSENWNQLLIEATKRTGHLLATLD